MYIAVVLKHVYPVAWVGQCSDQCFVIEILNCWERTPQSPSSHRRQPVAGNTPVTAEPDLQQIDRRGYSDNKYSILLTQHL